MMDGKKRNELIVSKLKLDSNYENNYKRMKYISSNFGERVSFEELGEYKDNIAHHNLYFKNELGLINCNLLKYFTYILVFENNIAVKTIYATVNEIISFIEYCRKEFDKNFNLLDTKEYMFKYFLDNLESKTRKFEIELKTAQSKLIQVVSILTFMNEQDFSDFRFIAGIEPSKIFPTQKPHLFFKGKEYVDYQKKLEAKTIGKAYTYDELEKIYDYSAKHLPFEIYVYTMVALHTGLRNSEIINLNFDCIEKEKYKDNYVYWLSKYKYLKNKQKVWQDGTPIKIPKFLYDLIVKQINLVKKYENLADEKIKNKLFQRKYNNKNIIKLISSSNLSKYYKILAEILNIERITSHRFRHSFAKLMYDKGIPLEYIRKYLNHNTEDMSASYIDHTKKENSNKYKNFMNMTNIAGGAKEKARHFQNRLGKIYNNTVFQGMSEENQTELLSRVAEDEGVNIQVMDHGICMLPDLEMCPNKYTSVNSCLEEHCDKFIVDEKSIPFLEDLKKYKELSIENLKKINFLATLEQEEIRLCNTKRILEDLKANKITEKIKASENEIINI